MKNKKFNTEHLTQEMMLLYLRDKLHHEQMFSVEKHLDSCAFCSEAMEGLALSGNQAEISIAEIRTGLANHKEEKKNREWYKNASWYGIAASAILVLVSILLIRVFNKDYFPEDGRLTDHKVQEKTSPNPPVISDAKDTVQHLGYTSPSKEKQVRKTTPAKPDIVVAEEQAQATDLTEEAIQMQPLSQQADTVNVKFEKLSSLAFNEQEKVISGNVQERNAIVLNEEIEAAPVSTARMKREKPESAKSAPAAEYKEKPFSIVVKGKVLGEDGSPLPGVNIIEKGTVNGIVTDINGSFEIAVSKGSPLVVSMIGYSTEEVQITDSKNLTVNMSPDVMALSEVVVVGYGTQSRKDVDNTIPGRPEPLIGLREYNKYIKSNIETPAGQMVDGVVVVKFYVKANGTLSDFRIVKGIGPKYDEEAIRLIKEGSGWKPATMDNVPVDSEATVRIRFRKN